MSAPFSYHYHMEMPYWSTFYFASGWVIRLIMLVYVPQNLARLADLRL